MMDTMDKDVPFRAEPSWHLKLLCRHQSHSMLGSEYYNVHLPSKTCDYSYNCDVSNAA